MVQNSWKANNEYADIEIDEWTDIFFLNVVFKCCFHMCKRYDIQLRNAVTDRVEENSGDWERNGPEDAWRVSP